MKDSSSQKTTLSACETSMRQTCGGGRRETLTGRTARGRERTPSSGDSKALCLPVCCCQTTISYVTLRLSARLYDEGHSGFTRSQCASLQSKVGGTQDKKKKKKDGRLDRPSKPTAGTSQRTPTIRSLRSMHKKKPLNIADQFPSWFVKEATFSLV